MPWIHGTVNAVVNWDPDGAGPLSTRLVVGGTFHVGDSAAYVATWDGSQWQAMPAPSSIVKSLVVWNGDLVCGGVGGLGGTASVERWNGLGWQTLGTVTATWPAWPDVRALAVYGSQLYVGGRFALSGTPWQNLVAFDGISWSFPTGHSGEVHALRSFDNRLYVGKNTSLVNWNGVAWSAPIATNGPVRALGFQDSFVNNGQLYAAGDFTTFGALAAPFVARYSTATATWSTAGAGLPSPCAAISGTNSGALGGTDVIALLDSSTSGSNAWRFNGTTWSQMTAATDSFATAAPKCLGYFGGPVLGMSAADRAARVYSPWIFSLWNWNPLRGANVPDNIYAVDANGSDLVIGGSFATIAGTTVNGIARGSHGAWSGLGSGLAPGGAAYAIARSANGNVIVGGSFATAGGVTVNNIARWNGVAWSSLGTGMNGTVQAIRVLPDSSIVAGGYFTTAGGNAANRIARWNGVSWQPLGAGLSDACLALTSTATGDVVAGGLFLTAGGVAANRIARWNGTGWSALGTGVDAAVYSLAVRNSGAIVAGGAFLNASGVSAPYVAEWNGSGWSSLWTFGVHPLGTVTALAEFPSGELVAGGGLWQAPSGIGTPVTNTAAMRLTGSMWSQLNVIGVGVTAAAVAPDGDLVLVGEFARTGPEAHGNVARLESTCPATGAIYGAGCVGSGGINEISMVARPWLGGTYRGLATGMPNQGFAAVVTGLQSLSVPIASLLPEGLPGCTLLVTPDVIEVAFPVAGQVATALAIPWSVSLVGAQLRQQVAPFDTNAGGVVIAITSTNALLLTIGRL